MYSIERSRNQRLFGFTIRDRKTKKQELRYREIENIELRIEIQLETTIDLSEDTLKKKYS